MQITKKIALKVVLWLAKLESLTQSPTGLNLMLQYQQFSSIC